MKNIIKLFFLSLNVLSFIFALFLGIIGVGYELLGSGFFEKILTKLNFNWNIKMYWFAATIVLLFFIATNFILKKINQGE